MKKKKKIIAILVVLVALIIAIYAAVNIYVDSLISKTNTEEIEDIEVIEDETPTKHDVVNFMLVGADNLDADRYNSYTEERSDVFKIVSLDYTERTIKLTSLDRDIVVYIPDKNEFGRFNWAYSFGGGKYALNTINYNLDLDVEKYVAFSFAGFINVIDKVGGIELNLTQEVANILNGDTNRSKYYQEGMNELDGRAALTYARIRHLDSDFKRMDRQNDVITAVINKLKTQPFTNLLDIVNECLPYITTNLETNEIKSYLTDLLSFNLNSIKKHTYPTNREKDVCINLTDLGGYLIYSYVDECIALHKFIYGTEDYKPTQRIYDNEKLTYKTFGQYYEGSELLP